ncbi:hypothetical protein OESDEN_15969 [Oesophagostomum dentatum]|uniref:DSBA-like thioredoxin domain-containing protein n=1 Tax=Oesophagostomum dentatum TaxID=61180 RepID=A0A0B1SM82_OESDE|nr:hypothetical protein OESDEN_15969 [Oesophagostomum dentatum]
MLQLLGDIDFVPISDVKLALLQFGDRRTHRRRENSECDEVTSYPKLLGNTEFFAKEFKTTEDYLPPIDWKETYASVLAKGSILPALFLCSVKHNCPEHFVRAVEVVGERIWERRLPVHKGAHMSVCAREAGLPFVMSESIVSRLSHMDTRQLLEENSKEAFIHGVTFAPLFVSSNGSTVVFHNFHDFRAYLQKS